MNYKNDDAYKSIGEVAKILELVNTKKKNTKHSYYKVLGKRV